MTSRRPATGGRDHRAGGPGGLDTVVDRPTVAHVEPAAPPRSGPDADRTTPGSVLVLTTGRTRGALTATRALGRAGWRVAVGTPDGDGLAARSRWCTASYAVPRPRGDGSAFVTRVTEVVRHGGFDLVVGGADDWAAALAHWADRIPCAVGHPAADVVRRAMDKLTLAETAAAHGLRAPWTEPATDQLVEQVPLPVVVKCRVHWAEGLSSDTRIEAAVLHDRAEVRAAVAGIRQAGLEPLLQEPVAGQLSAVIGVVVDGRLVGRVSQRAGGTWPTPTGVSSRAITVEHDHRLVRRLESMLASLGWSGIVEVQFLTPDADDPVLIDLNGRYFGSMALAVEAGPNLPHASALVALGADPGPVPDGRTGVRYSWVAGDLRRAVTERRGGLVRDVLTTLAWAVRATTASVLTVRDAAPALWLVGQRLRRRG